jgi:hypothetical protein
MATPNITVTIASGARFTRTLTISEFRKNLALDVAGSGLTAATIYAELWHAGIKVAEIDTWTDGYLELNGTGSLNTIPLETVFAGRAALAQVPIELRIYSDSDGLIASGLIPCRNNPPEGFDPPAALDTTEYLKMDDYDADGDGKIDAAALPAGYVGANFVTETFTLSAGDITAKYVTLTNEPTTAASTVLILQNGGGQFYGVDFAMDGTNHKRVTWSGLALDGVLAAADNITIQYN